MVTVIKGYIVLYLRVGDRDWGGVSQGGYPLDYIVDRTPDWQFGGVFRKSGKMTLFCLQTQFSFVSRIFSLKFQQSNCTKLQLQNSCQRQFSLGVRKRP